MLKKLGSALIYLILKTIGRGNDLTIGGYVINPMYISYLDDTVSNATNEELEEIKKEMVTELEEGEYYFNEDFLENLNEVFSENREEYEGWVLYKLIKESFIEVCKKNEINIEG